MCYVAFKKFFNTILILSISIILFSCNNKNVLHNDESETHIIEEETTKETEIDKKNEEIIYNDELKIGKILRLNSYHYPFVRRDEYGEINNYNNDNRRQYYDFIIRDFDEEKVLVSTKLKNYGDDDFYKNYNIGDSGWGTFIINIEQVAIANIIKNTETDSDVFRLKSDVDDKKNDEIYMYLKRDFVENVISGFYEKINKENEEIKNKYKNVEVEVSADGKIAYVKDYTGGSLDANKYGKYEILDFSKNEAEYIFDTDWMFADFHPTYLYENGKYKMVKRNPKEIRLKGLNLSHCVSLANMFNGTSIEKIDFTGVDLSNVYNCYKTFNKCQFLESINGFNLNSDNLRIIRGAFFKCENLKELNLGDINTSKVRDFAYTFYKCRSLKKLDVSKFDTSSATDMSYMFGNMRSLEELDLSKFNTDNVKYMSHMFYRCESIENLDLNNFNTKNLSDLSYMFYCCYNLKNLNISSFDTKNFKNMHYFMYFCNSIETLNFDNFINNNLVNCDYMFRYCENLKTLNMKNVNLSLLSGEYIFDGCISLVDYNLNLDSLNNITNPNEKLSRSIIDNVDKSVVELVDGDGKAWNWAYEDNAKNIKRQIDDLKYNKDLVLLKDRKTNISNRDIMFMNNNAWDKLLKNEFLVKKEYEYMEFYNYYEETRYNHFPNFVTSDSMLHTYHLYFDYLMKKIEKNTLYEKIKKYTSDMLKIARNNYNLLKGTALEANAATIVAYFSVPASILDDNFVANDYVEDIVSKEYEYIESQSYIGIRPLFMEYFNDSYKQSMFSEDYTQYKPRGHYDSDELLEKYFKVLMWYGRVNFASDYDELNKCALLLSSYMNDEKLLSDYNEIKNTIYYFVGESDDNGVLEYINVINKVFGNTNIDTLVNNLDKYNTYVAEIKKLKNSVINSSPLLLNSEENNVNLRLIGQTYTYDEEIFTNMMYDKILKNGDKKRYLPDFLDVPACLNSDIALEILQSEGKTDYPNYDKMLEYLRNKITNNIDSDNKNILYNKWMKALYRLLEYEKQDYIFPSFMRNFEWKKKTLETFGGSYAELKHDTILYTKQAYGASECGEGGFEEFYDNEEYELDDKGYVEPVIALYSELKTMSSDMKEYFSKMNLLDDTDIDFLNNFGLLSAKLEIISDKELKKEELTLEEYELIEGYGATIEHLIIDSGAYEYDKAYDYSPQPSNAIIADIATGDRLAGDFRALEIATGNPIRIFVLVEVNGKYKICQGACFDFYQFEVEPKNRMTDVEWRVAMGFDTGFIKTKDGKYVTDYRNPWWDDEENKLEEGSVELTKDSFTNDFKFQDWTNSYKEKGLMFSERINTYYIDHCGSYRDKNICVDYQGD